MFSTALPAIADDHEPGERLGTPSWSIAGVSAAMNQSETKAAPTPADRQQADRDARARRAAAACRLSPRLSLRR